MRDSGSFSLSQRRTKGTYHQRVFCRVLSAQDYTLILGLPGTGKTSTIASAVMELLSLGKSVLLTSYTNSAVDNVMLKLVAMNAKMLRLGRSGGVHPALLPYMLGGARFPDTRASDLKAILRDACLVCDSLARTYRVFISMRLPPPSLSLPPFVPVKASLCR